LLRGDFPLQARVLATSPISGDSIDERAAERPLDKGHMVPHQVGGMHGQTIYPQDRDLNRGWSAEGRRYRALEREVGRAPRIFFFHRLVYIDQTDFPGWVELGVLQDTGWHEERFRNR
jgi:hypothetical protein